MTRLSAWLLAGLLATGGPLALACQSPLEQSPNIHGVWGLRSGQGVFVFAHRFEFLTGDEVMSIPTFTLAAGLPFGFTLGTDFTTFSEAIPDEITENEYEFWLKRGIRPVDALDLAVLGGYNITASSWDGALNVRFVAGRFQLFAEGRAFSDLFGSEGTELAGAVGFGIRLTEHLALTGDIGQVLTVDDIPAAWSAALAAEIPGAPHTLSLQVTNTGATTLQGASREKVAGTKTRRYGFSFVVPIGSVDRWARLFRPLASDRPTTPGAELVAVRQYSYEPAEITIDRGTTVEWVNRDPVVHTATALDGTWNSGSLGEGDRWTHTFTVPGRYSYYCIPHPEMRGVIVVR